MTRGDTVYIVRNKRMLKATLLDEYKAPPAVRLRFRGHEGIYRRDEICESEQYHRIHREKFIALMNERYELLIRFYNKGYRGWRLQSILREHRYRRGLGQTTLSVRINCLRNLGLLTENSGVTSLILAV